MATAGDMCLGHLSSTPWCERVSACFYLMRQGAPADAAEATLKRPIAALDVFQQPGICRLKAGGTKKHIIEAMRWCGLPILFPRPLEE